MNEREQLLTKLVTTMHLSAPERAALGSKGIRYSEVAVIIGRLLKATGRFPPNARLRQEGQDGDVVYEGAILQKLPSRRFRLTLQRSHPTAPTLLAAKKESHYLLARSAIRAFIRSEWPNGIDGISITTF